MPETDRLERAGIPPPFGGGYDVVLLDASGGVLAAHPVQLVFYPEPTDDFDGEGASPAGVTVGLYGRTLSAKGGFDCNDFDARRFPGSPEVGNGADPGFDEDCDPTTFGERDRDGDRFYGAAFYNYDPATRIIYRGDDCNDTDPTANPIRPENCRPGTQPHERDAALRAALRAQLPVPDPQDLDAEGDAELLRGLDLD